MSSSSASAVGVIPNAPPVPYPFDSYRDRLEYELTVRQEPKQARMCGVGGKADRRPIDPPPIVQLRVVDPLQPSNSSSNLGGRQIARASSPNAASPSTTMASSPAPSVSTLSRDGSSASDSGNVDREGDSATPTPSAAATSYAQSYLQNPYYFMFACLAKPDDDTELHWLKDGRTRCTTGSVVSSLYHLKDPQHGNEDAGFFVFPDLSVRTEGSYRLKLSLYEVVGSNVRHCRSIFSAPFYVYTAKKFPGMEESTPLSCSLADQGIKIRIRKDIRVRKRPVAALLDPQPMSGRGNNANVSNALAASQHTFGAQSQFSSTPGVSASHFSGSSSATASAPGLNDTGYLTHFPPQLQQHTYASFPLPLPPQTPYQQQYHPLAPPPGSIPAGGPLQPLPPEAQPAWSGSRIAGTSTTAAVEAHSGGRGRRSESPNGTRSDDDDPRSDLGGPSDPATVGGEDVHEGNELGMRMDIDDPLRINENDSDNDDELDEGRPSSSSDGRLTRTGRRRTGSTRESSSKDKDKEERRKSKDSPKLRSKSSSVSNIRRELKRARTDSYQQPQYHQPIAPAPWAPAPHPPFSTSTSSSVSSSSLASGSNPSTIGGPNVPAPVIDPSLNGASIGGLPPGVRIPPPPGAIIAPGAPNKVTGASRSSTPVSLGVNPSIASVSRIPPPPGATIEASSTSLTTAGKGSGSSANNASGSIGITQIDTNIVDTPVQGSESPVGSSAGSSYHHQQLPFEQPHAHQPPMSGPPPPAYSVQAQPPQLAPLPPPHQVNSSQYPSHMSHPSQQTAPHQHPLPPPLPHSHSLPGPTPYNPYRQPPIPSHPQYGYSAPPHATYNAVPPPPPMAPPTPQGYAGYPAWGVNSGQHQQHQQIIPQEQYQQPMSMQQLQYQQPGYSYPLPPPTQVRPYEYGQPLQPQPQTQHMYAPYGPPYGYYDAAQQQPGAPPQQLQQNPFHAGVYGGTVGTPSPSAIGAAPIVSVPPLLRPGQPGHQSTTPPNGAGSGYVDYGSSPFASQPPGLPRPGSPRSFQQAQPQQYGYPSHPPGPPHHPHSQYSQHSQPHPGPPAPYPPPYGYMAYGNGNGNVNSNGSLPTTPGFGGNNGAPGTEAWGGGTGVPPSSGAPTPWDSTPSLSVYPGSATNSQSHVGVQSGNAGDRIQLAPMRQPNSGSELSGMYPIIQLRSSSRSSRDEGKERSGSGSGEGVAKISTTGREKDRGRDRDRDVGQSGRDRERDKERDSRDNERGPKKNPLAIGNIIQGGH
ncbi:velvet factor-domain-containing protein [Lentinula lateritia]|uniref:Velvet factor-domain-containing protein n=1 Tax=Lentinula lateritia TaxID=40482 RepID=A0ABQ8V097_9AGAR|nr:velvet factor-domain-containing protein [Lentinula lateritia]